MSCSLKCFQGYGLKLNTFFFLTKRDPLFHPHVPSLSSLPPPPPLFFFQLKGSENIWTLYSLQSAIWAGYGDILQVFFEFFSHIAPFFFF